MPAEGNSCTSCRGGGDLGRDWWLSAQTVNKSKTAEDFISCAQYLLDHQYTTSDNLVIEVHTSLPPHICYSGTRYAMISNCTACTICLPDVASVCWTSAISKSQPKVVLQSDSLTHRDRCHQGASNGGLLMGMAVTKVCPNLQVQNQDCRRILVQRD